MKHEIKTLISDLSVVEKIELLDCLYHDLSGHGTDGDTELAHINTREAAILKALTTNPAELMAIQAERGAIAPGQFADIIATGENPLDDINALKGVSFVMKEGTVVRQTH